MESKPQNVADKPSRLLELPREIRDIIYEHVLLYGIVPFEYAITNVQMPRSTKTTASECLEYLKTVTGLYPPTYIRRERRIWSIPGSGLKIPSPQSKRSPRGGQSSNRVHSMAKPSTFYLTYQLGTSFEKAIGRNVDLALLKVCKQTYSEAGKIFYSKNTFSFMKSHSISTAFAFLCDRPAKSLLEIRSLELALVEMKFIPQLLPNISGIFTPTTRVATDDLYLEYAYNHYTELCRLISTPRMQLRKLQLGIWTHNQDWRGGHPNTISDGLRLEEKCSDNSRPWIPNWIDPLLDIKDLEVLTVCWGFLFPRLRRMADTVSLMRQHMLSRQRTPLSAAQDMGANDTFYFRALHLKEARMVSDLYVTVIAQHRPAYWESLSLEDGRLQTIPGSEEALQNHETITRNRFLRVESDYLRGMYVFDCEIRGA